MKLNSFGVALASIVSVVCATSTPNIDEQFWVTSEEFDDTMNGTLILKQTIGIDPISNRTVMVADGSLVNSGGHMEQIVRCDVGSVGYFLNVGFPTGSPQNVCYNYTRLCNRPINKFWTFPKNISLVGTVPSLPNGAGKQFKGPFNFYEFWIENEKFNLFTNTAGTVPYWLGKVFTPMPNYHLWHFLYSTFKAGPTPIDKFTLPKGTAECKHMPPPNVDFELNAFKGASDNKFVMEMH